MKKKHNKDNTQVSAEDSTGRLASEGNHAYHVDKDLLKTPSGQMLQKLKDLRSSINRSIGGVGPATAEVQPEKPSSMPDLLNRAPVQRSGLHLEDDDGMSQLSAYSEISRGACDDDGVDSCASMSTGNCVLKFQRFFIEQCKKQSCGHQRCSIEALQAGLQGPDEVCSLQVWHWQSYIHSK